MLADISALQRQRAGELPLNRQVPLVGDRRPVIRIGRMKPHSGEAGGGRRRDTLHRAPGGGAESAEALVERDLVGGNSAVAADSAPLAHQVDVPRRVGRQAVEFARAFLEAGARERGAHHRLVIHAPGDAQARQEVGDAVVLVVQRAAVAVLSGEFDLPRDTCRSWSYGRATS